MLFYIFSAGEQVGEKEVTFEFSETSTSVIWLTTAAIRPDARSSKRYLANKPRAHYLPVHEDRIRIF